MESYVGPYRIVRLINRGGQGAVYLGHDQRLRRRVAIKIHDMPQAREGRRRLLREARLIASLDSPKIVQVHDVIESPHHLGMILEYVPGCSLEDMLRLRLPSIPSVMGVGIDVAGALAVARKKRVVHGDLKAANVLVSHSGHVKLTDFGIARSTALPQGSLSAAGSLSALSPEQCRGEALGEQADLFALGVLLYRLLTGEHPFVTAGRLDVRALARGECIPLRQRVGADVELAPELFAVVDELLHPDPERRPPNTRAARRAMRAVLREYPVAARYNLSAEATPFFREESVSEPGVNIPIELASEGRSRLPPRQGGAALLAYWFLGWNWAQRLLAITLSVALLLAPLALYLQMRQTSVRFQPITFTADAREAVPDGMTRDWLLVQLTSALEQRLGRVELVGEVGVQPRLTLLAHGPAPRPPVSPDYDLSAAVHCLPGFCVLDLQRHGGGNDDESAQQNAGAQGLLLASQGAADWSRAIRRTVAELFP
ncbi:MAG: hypothetical protein Hals2KO_38250 [Halioglobus sp.]